MNSTTDDLADAFETHADEALELANETFAVAAETWPAYVWGESVGTAGDTVIVPLNAGPDWVADLLLDCGQARELAETILDLCGDLRAERAS